MILTEAGDIGLYTPNAPVVVLRPSMRAIASLGTPAEIIAVFTDVMGGAHRWHTLNALAVLWACVGQGDEDRAADVLGYTGGDDGAFVPGMLTPDEIVICARHLLQHGVVGMAPERPSTAPPQKPTTEFKAAEYVALVVAHLGIPADAAWQMSMTSIEAALRAKFPEAGKDKRAPGNNAPTLEEHQQTMDWFEQVQAARKAKKHG